MFEGMSDDDEDFQSVSALAAMVDIDGMNR